MMTAKKQEAVKPVVSTEVKPTPTATAAPATNNDQKKEEPVGKQQKSVMAFIVAFQAANPDQKVKPEMITADGKFLLIRPWGPVPTVKVGPAGSYDIVEVKSFAKADISTMVKAKALYDKAQARYAKKQEAEKKTATPTPAAKPEAKPAVKSETPTQKKQREAQTLEAQLA